VSAAFDITSLGNLARILDDIPMEQLARAVEFQRKNPGQKLGEILVRLAVMSEDAVGRLLEKQRELREGKIDDEDLQRLVDFSTDCTTVHAQKLADAILKVGKKNPER
jgi:hypothetical protein